MGGADDAQSVEDANTRVKSLSNANRSRCMEVSIVSMCETTVCSPKILLSMIPYSPVM